jgi:sulfite reductase alpha subunit-like flavoprotein
MKIVCKFFSRLFFFFCFFFFVCFPLLALFSDGSQTGTAAMFADLLNQEAKKSNWDVKRVAAMDDALDVLESVESDDVLVMITSVFGEGVPPDNAKKFANNLLALGSAKKTCKFAVFGLGDSRYAKGDHLVVWTGLGFHFFPERFCKTGRDFQDKMLSLGFNPVLDSMGIGDASQDIEGQFDDFAKKLLTCLGEGKSSSNSSRQTLDRIEICNENGPTTRYREKDESLLSLECLVNRSVLPSGGKGRPHHEIVLSAPNLRCE